MKQLDVNVSPPTNIITFKPGVLENKRKQHRGDVNGCTFFSSNLQR